MPKSTSHSKWLVLGILAIALFMINLDVTIVNIALPSIMNSLEASLVDAEWVVNIYILVFAVSLITMGRFGDIFGRKRLFIGGLILFTTASFACGLSQNIQMLVTSRALQAFGGAAMMPATLSILNVAFKDGGRGPAMGVWGAVSGAASAMGPIIGGLLVDKFSWGYIFLVNIPLGVIAIIAGWIIINESTDPAAIRHIDWPGVGSATAGMAGLTFALIEGQRFGWSSPVILGSFGVFVLGLMMFFFIERRSQFPLIQLQLFKNVNFAAGNVVSALLMFGLIGILFLLVLYFQIVLGFSAVKTGLVLLPMSAVVVFIAPMAGRMAERNGVRWILASGMLIISLAIFFMAHLSINTTWQSLIIPLIFAGVGMGLIMAPVNTVMMAAAKVEQSGAASGIMTTMRQVGSLLGIAVLGAVLQARLASGLISALTNTAGIPESIKTSIINAINDGSLSAGGMGVLNGSGVPETVQAAVGQMFISEFANALNAAMVVAAIFCFIGAVAALFIKNPGQFPKISNAGAGNVAEGPFLVETKGFIPGDPDYLKR
ncbi:drug resistance transporter, EmrB/QacA subfamily [Dehalogenimonas formicexedens]|uniref:Drug resistance transporter, EmrB/QacA subfamily n=1 Tax=Dehalogenimonas formicexedens TaxID=1839801 RepID=A0A1P8F8J6_9CHLR|nr:MFS transporter [Dehalogenimonas formicexedens]APV44796.1 drug resistance transporter, EmrB/QacA subfamily [Dehalogenimonas formicexedens]